MKQNGNSNGKESFKGKTPGQVLDIFLKYEGDIIKRFCPDKQKHQGELRTDYLRNIGGHSSNFLVLTDLVEGKSNYKVWARAYQKLPRSYNEIGMSNILPWKKLNIGYSFLEKAGIKTPKTFLPREEGILFLEYIDGKVLFDKLDDKVLESLLDSLVYFQHFANEEAKKLSEEDRKMIFSDRPFEKKARDYLSRIFKPLEMGKEEIDRYVGAYMELVGKAFEGDCVCHGDLSDTNILSTEKGEFYFIDPELKFGNEFNDLGAFLAYAGKRFDKKKWDESGAGFKEKKLRLTIKEGGGEIIIKPELLGMIGARPAINLNKDEKRNVLYCLYANIFHYSTRIIAKNEESYLFKSCSGQEHNVKSILNDFVSCPKKFNISEKDCENAGMLKEAYDNALGAGKKKSEKESMVENIPMQKIEMPVELRQQKTAEAG